MRLSILSSIPSQVVAGDKFQLVVELDAAASEDVTVSVEKQRLVAAPGGYLELKAIQPGYFDTPPKPIVVKKDSRYAFSDYIVVSSNATDGEDGPRIEFPDSLLFSAFASELPNGGFSVAAVVIQGSGLPGE
jgi:hypothetical protein